MAFPDIPTVAGSRILTAVQANATSPRTFPSLSSLTKNAGDLLIAVIYGYQSSTASPAFTTWGASFTSLITASGGTTNGVIAAAYKFSTGSETGTFTVTQIATITGHAAMILMSIPGNHPSSPPEATSIAVGTTSGANPAALSPSWGTDDTLWITVGGIGETSTAGSFGGLTTSASPYIGDALTSISGDVVGGVQLGVAFNQVNAPSEDTGPWVLDTSNARNSAFTMAVRPTPPITVDQIMTGYARGVNPRAY